MSVVVIGGGLAGLNAALTLQEAGVEVDLYEASDEVGGRVKSDYIDGYIFDHGFQLINEGYSELKRLKLIEEIEFLPFSRSIDVVTPMGVSTIGDPSSNPLQALRSPLGSLKEKLSFIKYISSRSKPGESLEDEMLRAGMGDLYLNVVKPFLRGVFLAELDTVDAAYGKEIISTFRVGKSGLPSAGSGVLSQALAARIENIHLNHRVTTLDEFAGKHIIVATDAQTADNLLGVPSQTQWVSSTTWYHALDKGAVDSSSLRVSSVETDIINSAAISLTYSQFAPADKVLFTTTALTQLSEAQVQHDLEKYWGVTGFEYLRRYEISHSLPWVKPGEKKSLATSKVHEGIYRAGDYTSLGSQNAALLSGRFAATELLSQLKR